MSVGRMRLLHAIHDFLPRHRAGSEIYACDLARELSARHDVFVLAAEYDASTPHGTLRWRAHEGLTVVEIVNNWDFRSLAESYGSTRLNAQLRHVLDAVRPDVLHVHNLLNLTFDLPRLARERGAPSVATLHDYTLVCPSGGQRVHVDEEHVCTEIDPERCSRCFEQSAFYRQMAVAGLGRGRIGRLGRALHDRLPGLARAIAVRVPGPPVTSGEISRRLARARNLFDEIDWFVAPSDALAREYVRLGLGPERLEVSDYGFAPARPQRTPRGGPLRIGFAGTLVWHKGAHVLLDAARRLTGSFELRVYGDDNVFPHYSQRLRQMAAGLPIRFAGGFDRDELPRVFGGLDVLVVPSLWPENSPLVIHEAFTHGLAVVAARTGGIPGLVRDEVNGLLYDPFSPAGLSAALQRLIDDRHLPGRLAAAAPVVKTIEQDACEWEGRYGRLLQAQMHA